jgi:predicted DNA-binding transcriptional regulator AlpA
MAKAKLELTFRYVTAPQVRKKLGLSRFQLDLRIKRHILPAPTYTDPETQIRYFDENWVQAAKLILAGNNQRTNSTAQD